MTLYIFQEMSECVNSGGIREGKLMRQTDILSSLLRALTKHKIILPLSGPCLISSLQGFTILAHHLLPLNPSAPNWKLVPTSHRYRTHPPLLPSNPFIDLGSFLSASLPQRGTWSKHIVLQSIQFSMNFSLIYFFEMLWTQCSESFFLQQQANAVHYPSQRKL